MKYLITGITGFIGSNLARRLAFDGHSVHALVRSEINGELASIPGIQWFRGDLFAPDALRQAMKGCDGVFHLAAMAKAWAKDPGDFYRVNVEGAVNVFAAAGDCGVKKVVFTSSAATMSPSSGQTATDENTMRTVPFYNEYESTKTEAEEQARSYTRDGLAVTIVNPSRVYGPGPLNVSNSVTKMIAAYCKGNWRIIPGDGKKVGNYVFIDDVVNGHMLAMVKGRGGERYILGGDNLTFDEFFRKIGDATGIRKRLFHLPTPVMTLAARIMECQNKLTGIPPLITAPWVKKYLDHWRLSSEKAVRELGYDITPFETGVVKTLEWLENKK